jgi:ribonuclease P protein component
MGGERFPKRNHLTRRSDFLSLSRGGRTVYTPHFIVISKANDRRVDRLGITVSGKVGKAVVRNRVKRLLREFYRRQQNPLSPYRDFLIIARKRAGDLSTHEIARELGKVFAAPRK